MGDVVIKMDPERKAQWVAALRSGNFPQGKEQLLTGTVEQGSYCCLGVLCELYRRDTGNGEWTTDGPREENYFEVEEGDRSWSSLPVGVARWAGFVNELDAIPLGAQDPQVRQEIKLPGDLIRTEPIALANLNDSGTPFDEIADLIEEQL